MTTRVDPNLLYELQEFGADSAEKCINCGNCTAICPLSSDDDLFPRHIIRMAQLGLKDELLGSKELWLCYNCGECSETCPQQAEPANLMSAARNYAITSYSPFNISKIFFTKPVAASVIIVALIIIFGLFMFTASETMPTDSLRLFDFLSRDFIHTSGLVAMIVFALVSFVTIFTMIGKITRMNNLSFSSLLHGTKMNWIQALWDAGIVESLGQKRFRQDCDPDNENYKWFNSKWFIHASTMWGFLGLLLATSLNFLLDVIGVKATGEFVPLWYPTRLIGTLSGLLFIYGCSYLIIRRWRSKEKSYNLSRFSDWIFLIMLWLSGMTGFVVEIALYLPGAPAWGYWMFIVHVAISITMLLLLPFSKFAHAIYRIVALYIHALKPVGKEKPVSAIAD